MDGWLRLKNALEVGPKPEEASGLLFDVVVSPYDVPNAARGFKAPNGRFRIEFRYIDGNEPGREIPLDQHVMIVEGRHSHRLLAIEVDAEALGAHAVGVAITPTEKLETKIDTAWQRIAEMPAPLQQDIRPLRRAFESRKADLLQRFAAPA